MKRNIAPPLLAALVLANGIVWAHELSMRPKPVAPNAGGCKPMPSAPSPVESVQTSFQNWNRPGVGSGANFRTRIPCDCSDCTLVDSGAKEFYCENRAGQDCGKWENWFDDDFQWEAKYSIFACPDGKQYRRCGGWERNGCCASGNNNQPPSTCDRLNGRDPCSSRTTPCPNTRPMP